MLHLVGKTLGEYEIIEEIGRGGMAVVYKAWDTVNNRHVALKVLPPYFQHDTEFLRRFLEEARRTIPLRHPYIVETYDTGQADGYYYIAMEYMGGGNLAARLRTQRRLSLEDATTVVSQIAAALDHAHNQSLIHRDVKPSNILFDQSGQAKLADFGIAKAAGEATVTLPGTLVGTPEYMSPEQGQGRPVDEHTDIWSLGVVLYQMLTGRLPFGGDNPHATLYQVVHQRHLPVTSLNRNLPQEVDRVLDKALEKSPRRRYRRAGDMASELRQVVHRPTEEPTVLKGKVKPPTTRLARQALPKALPLPLPPRAIFGGLGALVLVAALVFGRRLISKPEMQPRAPAQSQTTIAVAQTVTAQAVATATQTAAAKATAQAAVEATQTATAKAIPEAALTFTATPIPSVPTGTTTPTSTATAAPTSTATKVPTSAPMTEPTDTPTTTATKAPTSTPTAGLTRTPTSTLTRTSMPVATLTPTRAPTMAPRTDTPTATQVPPTDTPPPPPTDTPPPPPTDTPPPPPTDTPLPPLATDTPPPYP